MSGPTVEILDRPGAGLEDVEIVERKGLGHPDTMADAIAERFSELYTAFSLAEFGAVAHHWVDKTMAIGGEARLRFGASHMVRPIRVLVVGKATRVVGGVVLPAEDLARRAAADVFRVATPLLDMTTDVTVEIDLNDAVGAGRSASWYRPAEAGRIDRESRPRSNDTVMCTGYAPLSRLESLVLLLEQLLNSGDLRARWPALGSDVKVLARRVGATADVVCCVPNVARLVGSRREYDASIAAAYELVRDCCAAAAPELAVRVALNTRDGEEVYLTHSGTALDTGDVGVVGRGNKLNGLIPLRRAGNIEAPCGKNPTYHGGRIYSIAAQYAADLVWSRLGLSCSVHIVAANGDRIDQPSFVAVEVDGGAANRAAVRDIVAEVLGALDRPARELPAVLRGMVLHPAERLTAAAWIDTNPSGREAVHAGT